MLIQKKKQSNTRNLEQELFFFKHTQEKNQSEDLRNHQENITTSFVSSPKDKLSPKDK